MSQPNTPAMLPSGRARSTGPLRTGSSLKHNDWHDRRLLFQRHLELGVATHIEGSQYRFANGF